MSSESSHDVVTGVGIPAENLVKYGKLADELNLKIKT